LTTDALRTDDCQRRSVPVYDVTIIGSGYGGSVMAARLAPHAKVLVLERGRRWSAGDFPSTLTSFSKQMRSRRNPLGLWDCRVGEGTGNAFANGLGGGSLLNYGITARPDSHVFDTWPITEAEMSPYYDRAAAVLKPEPNPAGDDMGDKEFLDMMEPGARVDLNNTIDWEKCVRCGNCISGCNHDAKRSLDKTFQPLAAQNGAVFQTETDVVDIRPRAGGGYDVLTRRTDGSPTDIDPIPTRHVIYAAGTLGTLDLMHRARHHLPTSNVLGQNMGMNGDAVAFLYNTRFRLGGHHGNPITTTVRLRFDDDDGARRTLTVMSGRMPKFIMQLTSSLMAVTGNLFGRRRPAESDSSGAQFRRRLQDLGAIRESGAMSQTYMYKLDGQDTAAGTARFDDEAGTAIDWADYTDDPVMRFAANRLEQWAERVGGRLIRDLGTWPGVKSYGVHPLGGCRMGTSVETGVVDTYGRLYKPDGSTYDGLRIVDGSIIPSSLGVPPSWTISAVAERAAEDLIEELKKART
jgi:cholesterol oxidase